jgi:hypothetical protein
MCVCLFCSTRACDGKKCRRKCSTCETNSVLRCVCVRVQCVCVCVCVSFYIHACTFVCMYEYSKYEHMQKVCTFRQCLRIRTHTHAHIYRYAWQATLQTYIHTYTHPHAYMQKVCMLRQCLRIRTHTHMHTYTGM